MIRLSAGGVVNLASLTHHLPDMQMGFKAPKGEVFVCVLLGTADKKDPDAFDVTAALRRLGWVTRQEMDAAVEAAKGGAQ
jgi:hypothetical protein